MRALIRKLSRRQGIQSLLVAFVVFATTAVYGIGYFQACVGKSDGPTGDCAAGGGACLITTNPNGKCGAAGPSSYCMAAGYGSVATTSQAGTCKSMTAGVACILAVPAVAGPPGTATPYCY